MSSIFEGLVSLVMNWQLLVLGLGVIGLILVLLGVSSGNSGQTTTGGIIILPAAIYIGISGWLNK